MIVSNVLRPVVYGKTVDLHPAVILMVLPAGAALAGIFGLFIAIPVAAAMVAVSGAVVSVLSEAEPAPRQPGHGPGIPVWVDRLGQWSIRFLVVAALGAAFLFVLGAVPLVVATGTIGIILAATFAPGVRALRKRGWGPGRAALFVTVAGWGIAIMVVVVSTAALIANAPELVDTTGGGATSISDSTLVKSLVSQVGAGLISTLTSIIQTIAGLAVTLLLSALLTFYFLRDGNKGWSSITRRFHGWRGETVDHAGRKAISVLSGYMISTGALSAFGAITQAIIMAVLGLPLILPIAFLSFILGFIPYIGGAIGTILAFLVAVKVGSTQDIIIMAIWTVVFNIVQGSFIAPIIYGKAVCLHPAVVLICIPAGGQLAGVMGMFLAVPLVGIVSAIWRSVIAVMSDRQHAVALVGSIPATGCAAGRVGLRPARSGPESPHPPSRSRPQRGTSHGSSHRRLPAGRDRRGDQPDPDHRACILMLFTAARADEWPGVPRRLGPRPASSVGGDRHPHRGQGQRVQRLRARDVRLARPHRRSACCLCCWRLRTWRRPPEAGQSKPRCRPGWPRSMRSRRARRSASRSLLAGVEPEEPAADPVRRGRHRDERAERHGGLGPRAARLRRHRQPVGRRPGHLLPGRRATRRKQTMDGWKVWLGANNATVMTVAADRDRRRSCSGQGLGGLLG